MEENNFSWISLPMYSSLTERVLLLGAPKSVLAINIVVSLLCITNFHFWYILLISIPLQFFCAYLSEDDAWFFDAYGIYLGKDKYYST